MNDLFYHKSIHNDKSLEKNIQLLHDLLRYKGVHKSSIKLVHGLLRSKKKIHNNKSLRKNILVNRDLNGSLNIRQKAICIINNKKIPTYLDKKFSRASSALYYG